MKEFDETPLPETESSCLDPWARSKIEELLKRVARLEERKVANEYNEYDPEWF